MKEPVNRPSAATAARMKRVRRQNTAPEMLLRRELHGLGLRYRVNYAPLGGRRRVDVAFPGARLAVFIDGCFWHRCPIHRTDPKSNASFWERKFAENVRRDRETDLQLEEAGWRVVRVWEHEDMSLEAQKIKTLLSR